MIYFVSDLHLGLGERESDKKRERDFLQFLSLIRSDCTTLVILGDLFDYWFEYNTVIPQAFFRTLSALDAFRREGFPVLYLMGNHDFGHQNFFERELNIPIYPDDLAISFYEKRFYLAHGDGKAYNDTGYLILKKILRNRLAQWLFSWIHPDIGIGVASGTSRKSRGYTDVKNYSGRDGLRDFAEKKLIANEADFVLMGHRHQPEMTKFGNGFYVNTGDWLTNRTFARFDGKTMELLKLDEFFANSNR